MKKFDSRVFVQRYFQLGNALKDRTINEKELRQRLINDLNMIEQLYNTKQLSKEDYDSVLEIISNFEGVYGEIISAQLN